MATAEAPHEGLTLLRTVASAVLDLDRIEDPGTLTLPYPVEAQRALDRTVLACLLRGATPPLTIPDLMAWCRDRPVVDWPLDLPDDLAGPEDRLIDQHALVPTDLCYEWAVDQADSAVEQIDRALIHAALDQCRDARSPGSYVAFRRLLIEHPVLSLDKLAEIALQPLFAPVDGLLRQIYSVAPEVWARDGHFYSCRRCKTLLVPTHEGAWWCENAGCRASGEAPIGSKYAADEGGGVLLLTRPLRLFVTSPGRAELKLAQALRSLEPELWPNYDAYDLRVTLRSGAVWAVDVKDWANPALLGRSATALSTEPPYDEAFIVVPDHRVARRKKYIEIVESCLPDRVKGQLRVKSHSQFVAMVREARRHWEANNA